MNSGLDDKAFLTRHLGVLLAFLFFVWTIGVQAQGLPGGGDPSALAEFGDWSLATATDSSADGSTSPGEAPAQHLTPELPPLKLSSHALTQLAFDGPRSRMISYPGLSQAPPSTL